MKYFFVQAHLNQFSYSNSQTLNKQKYSLLKSKAEKSFLSVNQQRVAPQPWIINETSHLI